jgi:hypothetical protein
METRSVSEVMENRTSLALQASRAETAVSLAAGTAAPQPWAA